MLTNRHKAQLASLEGASKERIGAIFGCYAGQVSRKNTHHLDMARTMANQYPFLKKTKMFRKLLNEGFIEGHQSDRVTVVTETHIHLPTLPPEPKPTGRVPGRDTARSRGEDVSKVDPNTPPAVSVAKKLVQLYHSAQKRGIKFDLNHDDVAALLDETHCYYTGVELTDTGVTQRTVERLDNQLGYVPGNVVAVSYQANQLKSFLFEDPKSELRMSPIMVLKMLYRMKRG